MHENGKICVISDLITNLIHMTKHTLTRGEKRINKLYSELVKLQAETYEGYCGVIDEDTLHASRLLIKEFKRLYDPQE